MQPKELVAQFIAYIQAQRFDEAKSLLAPEGFEYVGPNMRFLNRDDMLSYQFGMAAIQKDLIVRQLSADGEHVFAILDYQTHFQPIGDVRLAVWFRVEGDKIHTVEAFYNAAVVENMLGGNLPSANPL
ncbi:MULTISPECIES: nuclear transport factor 2 family protein [Marinobacter]|uniref:Nuclear transport factor 2 family protein n=1 Tax=Marinobacter xiaoshiensis TaxID=3073652 RepID=A0ABU2HLC5_9GAMM|nr:MULTISPECIES: nuclear transport factor 2 family protein [unclassified Marinobacter]MBK1872907.1 nuclear transport factor 2 family protein [Marinobacter sp. 1-3A]MBK1886986.1 nuclear transport factor 2 family protein [Marinobacter sp. DY40_1A1]MDS1311875.1 nuclear transport factor 2 family protein [Marinobacter sp. F60267]